MFEISVFPFDITVETPSNLESTSRLSILENQSNVEIEDDIYYHRELLINSIEGRRVDLLTITSFHNIQHEHEYRFSELFPDAYSKRCRTFKNKKVRHFIQWYCFILIHCLMITNISRSFLYRHGFIRVKRLHLSYWMDSWRWYWTEKILMQLFWGNSHEIDQHFPSNPEIEPYLINSTFYFTEQKNVRV